MILDFYFRKPVFWDYFIATATMSLLCYAFLKEKLILPNSEDSYMLTGDLTNIAVTMAGFILTILTVLITFKDNSKITDTNKERTIFNKFFITGYYAETLKHLKNCLKSIVVVAAIGFFIRLFLSAQYKDYFFFYNAFGLIITILTVWRCMLILTRILLLQNESK